MNGFNPVLLTRRVLVQCRARPKGPLANTPQSELAAALRACRNALIGVGVFSGRQQHPDADRLDLHAGGLRPRAAEPLGADAGRRCASSPPSCSRMLGVLDLIRSRIMVRIGASLDEALSGRVYETLVRIPLKVGNRSDGLQPLRDLDNRALVPVRLRPDRVFRSALDADLSRDLLRLLPFLDRHGRPDRRHHPGRADGPDRNLDQEADAGCDPGTRWRATGLPRFPSAMPRRSAAMGMAGRIAGALGRGQPPLHVEPAQGERRRRRPRRDLEGRCA